MIKNDAQNICKEFRRSPEARYIHRLHGVLLVLSGLSTVKAGKLLQVPQRTIAHWMSQFKAHGIQGLQSDKAGPPEKLSQSQKDSIWKLLEQSPRHFGSSSDTWTNAVLSSVLKKTGGLSLNLRYCSRLLRAFKNQKHQHGKAD